MTILIGAATVLLLAVYIVLILSYHWRGSKQFVVDELPDLPKPFGYKMAWLAVRTDDGEELARAIGLSNFMAANWNSGIGTVYDDALGGSYVYITPTIDGWTFVVGLGLPHPVGVAFIDKLTPLLISLGGKYTEVQYFFTYPLIDFFAWARMKDGKLVRAFAVNDEGVVWNKGRISKEERALGLRLFELRGVRGRSGDAGGELVLYPTEDHVLQIANGWGIDPTRLEETGSGEGRGFIAKVPTAWCAERSQKRAA
ncbi:MAG: hypothetical protein KJ622_09380 [Alphaproteobacteria bacterium]|nr:hypothetical protein [Alphaproteobacteria bacterium]